MLVSPHLPYYRRLCPAFKEGWLLCMNPLLELSQALLASRVTLVIVQGDAGYGCEESEEGDDQCEDNRSRNSPYRVACHFRGET